VLYSGQDQEFLCIARNTETTELSISTRERKKSLHRNKAMDIVPGDRENSTLAGKQRKYMVKERNRRVQ
jgi:hypothetical protein